jgi:hypothetical protein
MTLCGRILTTLFALLGIVSRNAIASDLLELKGKFIYPFYSLFQKR